MRRRGERWRKQNVFVDEEIKRTQDDIGEKKGGAKGMNTSDTRAIASVRL